MKCYPAVHPFRVEYDPQGPCSVQLFPDDPTAVGWRVTVDLGTVAPYTGVWYRMTRQAADRLADTLRAGHLPPMEGVPAGAIPPWALRAESVASPTPAPAPRVTPPAAFCTDADGNTEYVSDDDLEAAAEFFDRLTA